MAWPTRTSDPESAQPAPPSADCDPQLAGSPPARVATIGKTVRIRGEVRGNEDLHVEGTVVGKVLLNGHTVRIGLGAEVTAEIQARLVLVSGAMRGNVTADEKVEIAPTGLVLGDIRAPRVILSDGSRFNGTIDMDDPSEGPR